MPRNIVIAIAPMIASVAAAFFACGRRNAGTPSAIASTPVSAVAPEENARSSRNRVIAVVRRDVQVRRWRRPGTRRGMRERPRSSVRTTTIATKP